MINRRAFTMLELLVAIGLLAVLSAAVAGFTFMLFDREERTLALAERTHASGLLFDRLERDLLAAVAATPDGPGLVGDDRSLTVSSRAALAGSVDPLADDLQTTTIRFDRHTRVLTLERTSRADAPREPDPATPFGIEERFADQPAGLPGALTGTIADIRFRYHNGRSWASSFSSTAGLPVAVELSVWFEPYADDRDDRPDTDQPDGIPFQDETPRRFDPVAGLDGEPDQQAVRSSAPDRVRIIAIPDAAAPDSTVRQLAPPPRPSPAARPTRPTGGTP